MTCKTTCVCVYVDRCFCVSVKYLCSTDPDDPGGRDDDGGVRSQWAALLDLLQHEARHLVVILKEKGSDLAVQRRQDVNSPWRSGGRKWFYWEAQTGNYPTFEQVTLLWHHRPLGHMIGDTMSCFVRHRCSRSTVRKQDLDDLPPVCTTSSWWRRSLCCGRKTSAGNPAGESTDSQPVKPVKSPKEDLCMDVWMEACREAQPQTKSVKYKWLQPI